MGKRHHNHRLIKVYGSHAAEEIAIIRSSSAVEVISAVPPQSFNPTAMSRSEWRPVVRSPEQLRLHPALEELDWIGVDEFNDAARLTTPSVPELILITTNGTILAGFGRWRLAVFERRHEIHCIEHPLPLSEDEALQFIISHHQPQRGWNAFVRIRLALTLEPYLQQKALENMRAGGKYKGLANLPDAQHINVRQEIANFAGFGACARNVSNVKTILQSAHTRVIEALTEGNLSINCAVPWCKLPKAQQIEQFTNYLWERATHKVISQSIGRPRKDESNLDFCAVLDALRQLEVRQPGSVMVRPGRLQRTVILIGQDLLTDPHSQRRVKLT
jgi:hypothetical protein